MNTSFTIQSVHGLTQTFVLNPKGAVNSKPADDQREPPAEATRDRRDDTRRS